VREREIENERIRRTVQTLVITGTLLTVRIKHYSLNLHFFSSINTKTAESIVAPSIVYAGFASLRLRRALFYFWPHRISRVYITPTTNSDAPGFIFYDVVL